MHVKILAPAAERALLQSSESLVARSARIYLIPLQRNLGVDMTGLVSRGKLVSALFVGYGVGEKGIVQRRGREAASTMNPADIRRLPSSSAERQALDSSGADPFYERGSSPMLLASPHNAVGSARTSSLTTTRRARSVNMVTPWPVRRRA